MSLENNSCHHHHHHEPLKAKHHHHHHDHDHDHGHDHSHDHRHVDKKVLWIGFLITFGAMFVEIVAGVISNSLALISDAIHMFSHAFALGLSLFAIIIAQRKVTAHKTYGYHRMEIMAAFINGLTIALSVVWILYEAVERLLNPSVIDIQVMIIAAVFGLVVNIATGIILFRGDQENVNIRSAFFHMLADTLSSVAIIIGGVVVYYTELYWIDTVLALWVAIVIARWSWGLLRDSVNVLLAASPVEIEKVRELLENDERVIEAHDIHVSEITHRMYVMTAHIVIKKENMAEFQSLAKHLCHKLEHDFEIGHVTLQPEWDEGD